MTANYKHNITKHKTNFKNMQKQSRLSKFSCFEFSRLKEGGGGGEGEEGGGSMKSLQVRTRGEGGSEIGDFTAYVLYGCPLRKP